jgi:hypothetical protein
MINPLSMGKLMNFKPNNKSAYKFMNYLFIPDSIWTKLRNECAESGYNCSGKTIKELFDEVELDAREIK